MFKEVVPPKIKQRLIELILLLYKEEGEQILFDNLL